MSVLGLLRLLVLTAVCGVSARAWDISYAVAIGAQSDRWSLPSEDLTYVHGGTQGNVRYQVNSFVAATSATVQFLSVATGWDNYLVLYRESFDPNRPLRNAIAASDNYPVVGRAGFSALLTAGERYFVVTSAAANGSPGTTMWRGTTTVTSVPEPSTFALAGVALAACFFRNHFRIGVKRWTR